MNRVLLTITVVLLTLGIWILRDQTMTVHTPVDPGSVLLVAFTADSRTSEDPVGRLARAHLDLCIAESVPDSALVDLEEVRSEQPGAQRSFLARLRPGADQPDREQLHGCLEDLQVRHLRLEVTHMALRLGDRVLEVRDT